MKVYIVVYAEADNNDKLHKKNKKAFTELSKAEKYVKYRGYPIKNSWRQYAKSDELAYRCYYIEEWEVE